MCTECTDEVTVISISTSYSFLKAPVCPCAHEKLFLLIKVSPKKCLLENLWILEHLQNLRMLWGRPGPDGQPLLPTQQGVWQIGVCAPTRVPYTILSTSALLSQMTQLDSEICCIRYSFYYCSLPPRCRERAQDKEEISNWTMITQLGSGRPRMWIHLWLPRASCSSSCAVHSKFLSFSVLQYQPE